jgi:hypothetical protein
MYISPLFGFLLSPGTSVPFGISSIQNLDCFDIVLEKLLGVESTSFSGLWSSTLLMQESKFVSASRVIF